MRKQFSNTQKNNAKKLFHRPRRKYCKFCLDKVEDCDWKDVKMLKKHISESFKIIPRSKTGTCAKHQNYLVQAIKRARVMSLLPFTVQQLQENTVGE